MKHKYRSTKSGFTLVEIMIVVAIVGLLAVMALPSYVRARNLSQVNTCINNLRQISGGIDLYAIENNKSDANTLATTDITPYLKGGVMPVCPAEGAYTLGTVAANPTCNIALHILPN